MRVALFPRIAVSVCLAAGTMACTGSTTSAETSGSETSDSDSSESSSEAESGEPSTETTDASATDPGSETGSPDSESESDTASGSDSETEGETGTETGDTDTDSESGTETGDTDETDTDETDTDEQGFGPCADACGTPDCGPCPDAPMIEGPGYLIDATEVRVVDYAAFLDVEILDEYLAPECAWKPDYGGLEPEFWEQQINPEHPVTGVDWCDAETYCRWAGKRLCGTIGGGDPNFDDLETASDEWYQACSDGGQNVYPYGDDYGAFGCNGWDLGIGGVWPVGTLPACEGLEGVFDMSGNVWEWTAACAEPEPDLQDHEIDCRRRGGSWTTGDAELLRCGVRSLRTRLFRSNNTGFRCCATP